MRGQHMATDSTHLLPGDSSIGTDSDMSAGSPDLGSVQLAAAPADAPIPVNIPLGQQAVVIPVKPGQTIELPTDSVNGLLAKLGADGNLAIVVDGRTIILQGYADANAESPIKIVTNDGDVVDIAEVIVATSPDVALDIETAAGPAAGAQGGTGAPGSGIFVPLAAGPLLGGFDGEGVLKATQLAYKSIDDERVIFVVDKEGNNLPQDIIIVPDDGQPVANDGAFLLDEDFLKDGNHDLPAPSPQDNDGSAFASGTVVVNFGLDGPRAVDPIVMNDLVGGNGVPSGLFTTNGTPILLHLDAPAGGSQVLHGYLANPGVDDAFVLILDTQTGHFGIFLNASLLHDENSFEDNVALAVDFSAFDSNGDQLSATLHLNFDDDMPEVQLVSGEFQLAVDENAIWSSKGTDFDDPNFLNDGIKDGSAPEIDLVALPAALNNPAYGTIIGSAKSNAAGLFDVDFGADNAALVDSEVFSFTILDATTNLKDTETGEFVTLYDMGNGLIEGRISGGVVVFALHIDAFTGDVAMAQFRALDHGDEEDDPGAHDEVLALGSGFLGVTLTATDGDADENSNTADIGGAITFDDDGPRWIGGKFPLNMNEDDLPGGIAGGPGDDGVGTKVSGVINFNFGSDLPGTLSLSGATIMDELGNKFPLEDLQTSDGHDIDIAKSVDPVTGIITWEATVKDGPNAGDPVFTFMLDGEGADIGNYSVEFFTAVQHPLTDDWATKDVETAYEDYLYFFFHVVATDGDGDTATADIPFYIDDDSPEIKFLDASVSLISDETVAKAGTGDIDDPDFDILLDGTREEDDEHLETLPQVLRDIDTVIGAATDDASKLFSFGFGADGGAAGGGVEFALKILDANTGLVDTLTQQPITLHVDGDVIEGRNVDGDVVFALTVDDDGNLSMAQYRAVDHGDEEDEGGAFDEVLTLDAGKLAVTLTVTDADGDSVTAERDLGGAIGFEDDGPTADLTIKNGATLVLDESVGADAGDPNADDEEDSLDAKDIGFASILGKDLFTATGVFGSDGEGTKDITLELKSGNGTDSGLIDTQFGDPILLYGDGSGLVQGKNSNGDVVFTVSVNSDGDVEVHQYLAVEHNDSKDPDESSSPELLDPGVLLLQVTAEDGDGDVASDTIDLGSIIKFEDDGPTTDLVLKEGVKLVLDESVGADAGDPNADDEEDSALDLKDIATTEILGSALFTETTEFGSDGEAAVNSKLFELALNPGNGVDSGLDDTQSGEDVLLYDLGGGVIQGRTEGGNEIVFTITVNTSNGNIDIHQYRAVVHDDPADPDESDGSILPETIDAGVLELKLTVTDGDGDKASDTIDLGPIINFEDDGPKLIDVDFDDNEDGDSSNGVGIIDEDSLPDGIGDSAPGDNAGGTFVDGVINFDFGSDKAGSLSIDSLIVKDSAGNTVSLANLQTSDGRAITITPTGPDANGVVTWSAVVAAGETDAGEPVFTFKVDTSGANIGTFSFELFQALEHPYTDADLKNDGPDTAYEDNLIFDFTVKATDGDGDTATGHIKIDVDDDSPNVGQATSGTFFLAVDETVGGNGSDIDANGTNGTQQDGSAIENDEAVNLAAVTAAGLPTTGLIGANTASAAGLFTFDAGADEQATKVFGLSITGGGNTGLIDTATGQAITLFVNGSVIEGRNTSGDVCFALTIDATTGLVTMADYRAVNHGTDNPNSYPDETATMLPGKLAVTLTVTDEDGDSVTASHDISGGITIDDDGPTTDLALKVGATLILDETVGIKAGDANANDEAGNVVGDIGYATITAANLFTDTTAFGSDGAASANSKVFSLVVNGVAPVNSGLLDAQTNEAVILTLNGGVVEGRTAIGNVLVFTVTTSATGDVTVSQFRAVEHNDPADNDESGLSAAGITGGLIDLKVVVTDGDGDTASDTVDLGSIIKFEDDGPTADLALKDGATLVLDETVGTKAGDSNANDEAGNVANDIGYATITAANLFTDTTAFGSDGPAAANSKVFSLVVNGIAPVNSGLLDAQTNEAVILTLNGGVVEGRTAIGNELVFTVTTSATGDVRVSQFRAVEHNDPADNDESGLSAAGITGGLIDLKVVVTDGDGDTASDTVDLGSIIKFEDDGPTADLALKDGATLVLDETVGTKAGDSNANDEAGNVANDIGYATITAANLFTDTTAFGSDGAASANSKVFSLVVNGPAPVNSGLLDAQTNEAVILTLNGGVVEGRTAIGNELVFTVTTSATGDVTVSQFRAVEHNDPADNDESGLSAAGITGGLIDLKVVVTDGDGDTASDTVDLGSIIKFEDDGPTADLALKDGATLILDETVGIKAGDANANDEAGNVANDIGYATITAANLFTDTTAFGSDGAASANLKVFSLVVNGPAPVNSGLLDAQTNEAVILTLNGGVVEGRTAIGNELVFTVTTSATGDVTVSQFRAVEHNDPADNDESGLSAAGITGGLIDLKVVVTDGDGDTASDTVDLGSIIKFEDDGPTADLALKDGATL